MAHTKNQGASDFPSGGNVSRRGIPGWAWDPAKAWLSRLSYRDLKTLREVEAGKYVGDWCTDESFAPWCTGEHPIVGDVRGPGPTGGYLALTRVGEAVLVLDRERMRKELWRVLPPRRRDVDVQDDHPVMITARGDRWRFDEINDLDLESTILEWGGERPGYVRRSRNPKHDRSRKIVNPFR